MHSRPHTSTQSVLLEVFSSFLTTSLVLYLRLSYRESNQTDRRTFRFAAKTQQTTAAHTGREKIKET